LARRIASRSPDPCRYRALIVTCAEAVLAAVVTGDGSDANSKSVNHSGYPEWFTEEGCATANLRQRFKRARDDLRAAAAHHQPRRAFLKEPPSVRIS
jgi:hypothetical protein